MCLKKLENYEEAICDAKYAFALDKNNIKAHIVCG